MQIKKAFFSFFLFFAFILSPRFPFFFVSLFFSFSFFFLLKALHFTKRVNFCLQQRKLPVLYFRFFFLRVSAKKKNEKKTGRVIFIVIATVSLYAFLIAIFFFFNQFFFSFICGETDETLSICKAQKIIVVHLMVLNGFQGYFSFEQLAKFSVKFLPISCSVRQRN